MTVTKFGYGKSKDTVRVDIREFYEKDGDHLPGKKVRSAITDEGLARQLCLGHHIMLFIFSRTDYQLFRAYLYRLSNSRRC